MPKFSKAARGLFMRNWRTALLFELVYKALYIALLIPLENALLTLAMHASRCYYLTADDLSTFVLMPTTWLLFAVGLIVVAAYVLFEMCALVICFEAGREGRSISLTRLVELTGKQVKRIASRKNLGLVVFVLVLVPFANCGLISSAITNIHIPEFISEYIAGSALLLPLCIAVTAALMLLAFFWMFTVHYFTLFGMDYKQAHVASGSLMKKMKRYPVLHLALVNAALVLLTLLGFLISTGWLLYMRPRLAAVAGWDAAGAAASVTIGTIVYLVFSCVATPIVYAVISQVFYELLGKRGQEMPPALEYVQLSEEKRKAHTRSIAVISALSVLACFAADYAIIRSGYVANLDRDAGCTIIAHRGAAMEEPENTILAFERAIDEGADWVELDVQMLSDGTLIVMHDSNFKRTTGLDANVWDVTYNDIKDLDAGSWFAPRILYSDDSGNVAAPDFSSVRICTLDEALKACKGKVKMNIEVKPTGHGDDDLVQKTINEIKSNGMQDQVAIASLQYKCLEDAKRIDPSLKTIYNMTIAYGDISKLDKVDIFSIDEASLTSELVDTAHRYGKTVWAWTVNDPNNMFKMYSLGVDGLVTDDIETARTITDNSVYGQSIAAWQLLGDLSAGNNAGS